MSESRQDGPARSMFVGELSPAVRERFLHVHRVLFGADEVPSCLKTTTSDGKAKEVKRDEQSGG